MLFVQLLLVSLGAVLGCYLLGAALGRMLGVAPRERYFTLFFTLTLGLTGLVGCYAAVRTGGHTMMLPLLILLLLAGWQLRHRSPGEAPVADAGVAEKTGVGGLPLALGLGLMVFAARWLLLYDPNSPFLRTPFQDYVFYGRLYSPLQQFGLETNVVETLYPQFLGASPYHYAEVWLNVILVRMSGLPAVWCLYLATYSALITIVAVGFRAALAHYGVPRRGAALLALALVLVTGVSWPFFQGHSFFENGTLVASTVLPLQPKLAPVWLLSLLGLLLLVRGRYLPATLVLAGIPLVFISTLPSVCAGIVGLALYLGARRQLRWRAALWVALPGVVVAAYVGAFYSLSAKPFDFTGPGRSYSMAYLIPELGEARTLLNVGLGTLVNFTVFFAPYAVLWAVVLVLARRRLGRWAWPARFGPVLCWFGMNVLVATAVRAVGAHYLDSVQFFSNPVLPLAAVVFGLMLAAALAPLLGQVTVGAAVAVLVLALVNGLKLFSHTSPMHVTTRYSPSFLRQVAAALPRLGNRGGYLLGDADYESIYTMSPNSFTAGTYISNFKSDYVLTSLSALDPDSLNSDPRYAHDSLQAVQGIRRSSIYRFARFRAQTGHKPPPDSLKVLFVKEFKLRFLCASRRAMLPATLTPLVQAVFIDSLSGEKFYVLRPL